MPDNVAVVAQAARHLTTAVEPHLNELGVGQLN